MPRSLPWLNGASSKKKETKAPTPRQSRKRSSSPDRLVDSDLDDIDGPSIPKPKAKKRAKQEPDSSTPPIVVPEVEIMKEGLTADDIFMMVEDEFYSTAQLFTAPLHRAEYDRLKRLHKSRGAETLARISHGTDSSTKQSNALRLKMEAQELRKKRKTGGLEDELDESDDDDEYMAVPQLAGLMTSGQTAPSKPGLKNVAKAKSNTRAAAGFSQSPHKGNKTRDVFAEEVSSRRDMSPVLEEDDTDDEDDDDLDVGASKSALSTAWKDMDPALDKPLASIEKPAETKTPAAGFFKQFAKPPEPDQRKQAKEPAKSKSPPREKTQPPASRAPSSTPAGNGLNKSTTGRGGKGSQMAEILARRRQLTQTFDDDLELPMPKAAKPKEKSINPEPSPSPKVNGKPHQPHPSSSSSEPVIKREEKSSQYLSQRKVKQEKEDDKDKKKTAADIPTFLF